MSFIEILESWDRSLFLYLNNLGTEALDPIMLAISDGIYWTPVFLLLLFLLFKAYPGKAFFWVLLGIIISITLTDRLSVEAFKEVFLRYRPCHNNEIKDMLRLVKDGCGGQYGFVSSHAANYAGLATLITLLLRHSYTKIWIWMALWAGIIGYSRIYLGVHYPADVLGGWLLGIACGGITYFLIRRKLQLI